MSMKWTNEYPKFAGYYWVLHRSKNSHYTFIAEFYENRHGQIYRSGPDFEAWFQKDHKNSLFAGPLEEPKL